MDLSDIFYFDKFFIKVITLVLTLVFTCDILDLPKINLVNKLSEGD